MMRNRLLCLLLAATAAPAQLPLRDGDLTPTPEYTVARAGGPITIDGKLDEPAWQAAAEASLTYWWPDQTGPKDATIVRLLWDDEALYAAFDCADQDIVATHENRDDPTYRDDCVELFVLPSPERFPSIYVGLEMSARGVLYDYLCVPPLAFLKRFQLDGCEVAVQRAGTLNQRDDVDDGWTLEVRLPWINVEEFVEPPRAGWSFRAMLNRWNGVEPDRAMSLWSDSGTRDPSPHNAARFGLMTLAGEAPVAAAPEFTNVDNPVVVLETNRGTVYLELWPDVAPKHCASTIRLVEQGFYDGIAFHRVVPDFVVQAGCPFTRELPLDDPRIGTGGPGYTVEAEFSDRPHLTGTLSMARTDDPNSAGSQFFVCLGRQQSLDGKYTVFGRVLGDGMSIVRQIVVGDRITRATMLRR